MATLVFDIGATNSRLAVVQHGYMGPIVHMATNHNSEGFDRLVAQMQTLVAGEKLEAVVGGMRAQREGRDGRLILDTNLTAWLGIPVVRRLETAFNCPVRVENDAVMAGLGEAHKGAGATKGVMAYITVSSGVNFVRLIDGAPDPAVPRFELGRQLVGEAGGRAVSLEQLTGGAAMEHRYGRPPVNIHGRKVWSFETEHLARGLYNMMLYWAPEVIVFGGSMMKDVDLSLLAKDLAAWTPVWLHEPRLVRSKLGDQSGIQGAQWLSEHLNAF